MLCDYMGISLKLKDISEAPKDKVVCEGDTILQVSDNDCLYILGAQLKYLTRVNNCTALYDENSDKI